MHVARMGDRICACKFWYREPKERDHSEDSGVDGKIILRRIFRRLVGGAWTGLIWLRIGTSGGHL